MPNLILIIMKMMKTMVMEMEMKVTMITVYISWNYIQIELMIYQICLGRWVSRIKLVCFQNEDALWFSEVKEFIARLNRSEEDSRSCCSRDLGELSFAVCSCNFGWYFLDLLSSQNNSMV